MRNVGEGNCQHPIRVKALLDVVKKQIWVRQVLQYVRRNYSVITAAYRRWQATFQVT